MVYNREQAAQRAETTTTNTPGHCQEQTRNWFGVPSVGDLDGDGRADAEDGWKSEPTRYRHANDRTPPRGVPVSYLGGSHGDGHRAISLGNGLIRSTDASGSGRCGTVTLDWPERAWGLRYAGWSETCDGVLVPMPPTPKRRPKPVRAAIKAVKAAIAVATGPTQKRREKAALDDLKQVKKR